MTKSELLERIVQARSEWELLISQIDQGKMILAGVEGMWSVKDIIAHVAWYEWWSAEFIRTRDWPRVPEHLESDDTETRNRAFFEEKRKVPLDTILDEARRSYNELIEALQGLTDEEFDNPALLGMPNDPGWRISAWIPENTYLHYEQHAASIRAWLARPHPPRRTGR